MSAQQIQKRNIGRYKSVDIELITWDATMAEVDLTCACLFMHELNQAEPIGGLKHLDIALDGALFSLRKEGLIEGRYGESLLIDQKMPGLKSERLLIIGMGSPEDWTDSVSAYAVDTALRLAYQLNLESVAIAPSILDTGIDQKVDISFKMIEALKVGIDKQEILFKKGLVKEPSVKYWFFDSGFLNFDSKAVQFKENFNKIMEH